jgi:hypothetical protein
MAKSTAIFLFASRRIHSFDPNTILWEVPGADHCGAINAAPQEFKQKLIKWFSVPTVSPQELRTEN